MTKRLFLGLTLVGISILASAGCNLNNDEGGSSVADTPPIAPSNVVVDLDENDNVILTWDDNSNNEEGFIIQRRKLSASTFSTVQTIRQRNLEEYTDYEVRASTTYYYMVRAYNAAGWSEPSETVHIRTPSIFGGGDGSCGCLGIEPFLLVLLIGLFRKAGRRLNPRSYRI